MKNPITQVRNLTICILLIIVPRSFAVENIYSGIDLGLTHFSGDGPADTQIFQKGQHFSDSHFDYGIHVGYQITDWLAVELAYTDFGRGTQKFKISRDVVFVGKPTDTQTIEANALSISAMFNHEITESFSAFGLLGIASMNYESTLSGGFSEVTGNLFSKNAYADQGIIYGVGLKCKMTDALGLRADLRRNDVGDFVLDSATIGIEYSF